MLHPSIMIHYDLIKSFINSLFSSIWFRFRLRGGSIYGILIPGFLSLISWFLLIQISSMSSCSIFWDLYLLLCAWSRIDLMFKGLLFVFVWIWSRIDLISELSCDPRSISYCNFILWPHVFPNRSHISQRGANVCTQKWSPRLWAPFIWFINLWINFINLSIFF